MTDDGRGHLSAKVVDDKGADVTPAFSFTSTYDASGNTVVSVTKMMLGRKLAAADVFTFDVCEGGKDSKGATPVLTGTNSTADNAVNFGGKGLSCSLDQFKGERQVDGKYTKTFNYVAVEKTDNLPRRPRSSRSPTPTRPPRLPSPMERSCSPRRSTALSSRTVSSRSSSPRLPLGRSHSSWLRSSARAVGWGIVVITSKIRGAS